MSKETIFYIMTSHLTKEAGFRFITGELNAADITSTDLLEMHRERFEKSEMVIFKKRSSVDGIACWITTLIKGSDELREMVDNFPMVDVEVKETKPRLYTRGKEIIGHFDSQADFIQTYKKQLSDAAMEYVAHYDYPASNALIVKTNCGNFKIDIHES